jgi:hypothetical protein
MKRCLLASVMLVGCMSAAQVNASRSDELKTRAAFDLKCDASALKVTDLTTNKDHPYMRIAGVDGCGQRATYAWDVQRSTWFMDAASATPSDSDSQSTSAAQVQKEAQP